MRRVYLCRPNTAGNRLSGVGDGGRHPLAALRVVHGVGEPKLHVRNGQLARARMSWCRKEHQSMYSENAVSAQCKILVLRKATRKGEN